MSEEAVTLSEDLERAREDVQDMLGEAQALLEEVRLKIEPERIDLSDDEREEIRANLERLSDDELVCLYMTSQKILEQNVTGETYDFVQRQTTFTSVLLNRFAPVEFANHSEAARVRRRVPSAHVFPCKRRTKPAAVR